MKNHISVLLSVIFFAATLSGCATQNSHNLQFVLDKSFSPESYQTYSLESVQSEDQYIGINTMIAKSINKTMAEKGYTSAASGGDFIIRYATHIEHQEVVSMQHIPAGKGIYTRYEMEPINVAEFLVNIINPEEKKVIWKASASRDITGVSLKDAKQENVDEAIANIFSSVPAK